jgi:hypothetical protein
MPATSEARRCQVTIRDSGPLSRHPARTGDGRHLRRQEWAERAPHRPSGQCHDPRDESRRPSPDQAWRHRPGPRRTGPPTAPRSRAPSSSARTVAPRVLRWRGPPTHRAGSLTGSAKGSSGRRGVSSARGWRRPLPWGPKHHGHRPEARRADVARPGRAARQTAADTRG